MIARYILSVLVLKFLRFDKRRMFLQVAAIVPVFLFVTFVLDKRKPLESKGGLFLFLRRHRLLRFIVRVVRRRFLAGAAAAVYRLVGLCVDIDGGVPRCTLPRPIVFTIRRFLDVFVFFLKLAASSFV